MQFFLLQETPAKAPRPNRKPDSPDCRRRRALRSAGIPALPHRPGGFSLVEVVLAIGITAFAILTILGLLGTALKSNSESEERIQAANLATSLLIQYRDALNNGTTIESPLPALTSIQTGPDDDFSNPPKGISLDGKEVNDLAEADYALSWVVWKSDTLTDAPYELVNCSLKFQWPAAALKAKPSDARADSYEVTTSFLISKQTP